MRTNFALGLVMLLSTSVSAAPLEPLAEDVLDGLDQVESAWQATLLDAPQDLMPFDDAIFTDLSPILTVPEAVKLPPDQQLED